MARFTVLPTSPLPVQFWLLGLDAQAGLLTRRGFRKVRREGQVGSSLYHFGGLTLHSSGLWVELPQGQLCYQRRPHRFTLNGQLYSVSAGLQRIQPHLLEHEAWVVQHLGADYRERQLAAHQLPPPIRRNVRAWREWRGGEHGLAAMLWQVPEAASPAAPALRPSAFIRPTAEQHSPIIPTATQSLSAQPISKKAGQHAAIPPFPFAQAEFFRLER